MPKSSVKNKNEVKIKEPKMYNVIMYNDDFTTMEFVIFILVNIFKKSDNEAFNLMMLVHKSGKAIVGKYTYDIAKTKSEHAISLARKEGFPFKVVVKEV